MSELRKYGVGLTLTHQHLHQLDPDLRHAVLGNAATLIAFRIGPEDAGLFSRSIERLGRIIAEPVVGGLHHRYARIKFSAGTAPHRGGSAECRD
jgi:hypothetical protein